MKYILPLFLILLLIGTQAYAQERTVSGRVSVDVVDEGLPGVTVTVKGTQRGVVTDNTGRYEIVVNDPATILVFRFLGYQTAEVLVGDRAVIDITLEEDLAQLDEVVVSGTRRAEKITETPATIETISAQDLQNLPTFNPGELLARLKGVEFVRAGVVGTGINVRGFNSNFNSKNLQVTDGRFSSLIATGLPMGPLNTVIKEDIERVEVVLGPNSALFGPNAHNGLVNTITKDPRTSEGLTVAQTVGNQSTFSTRMRYAHVFNDQWAFKVTGEHTTAEEFEYVDSVYINRDTIPGTEGYPEYMLDRDIEFNRGEAAFYYTPVDGTDIIFQGGASNSTYLSPTNVGRNQIIDWNIYYAQAKLVADHWFAQVYHTWSKTEDTYSIDDRTKAYYTFTDLGFPEDLVRDSLSYTTGALFKDDSRRWNGEIQYNNQIEESFFYTIGAQYQRDMANSKGTYLLDENEEDYITIDQVGVYGQFDYKFGNGLKLTGAFRGDNHEVYGFNFLPKVGVVYSGDFGGVRLTYGRGIAAPTILNMYGDLFNGLILGNAEGFTLADGTEIEKQTVEKLQTIELGYKGVVVKNKLFVDANAYYNISEDFLSPVTVVGVTTQRGDTPIEDVQSGYAAYGGLVATYINFGKFNTYGFDLGLSYFFNDALSANLNYSYFGYDTDENNLENDFNNDGVVNKLDLLVNAPRNKASFALNYVGDRVFGSVFTRWVQEFDYFSSFQIAAETQDLVYRGVPIVEDARSADAYNYGPLGGFVTFDVSLGYKFSDQVRLSGQVTNLFDTEQREFTAAPPTGRLYSLELRVDLPPINKQ
ncbi:TonB-dependent receptor domain-containing protein [Roseivirga sp. BDSF3-8]|uniref:TonB-dependent receptor n=1 Tax=Roseivirga sp. BDSF3-8 TaxID=3241598 RepID=UPI003531D411